VACEKGSTDDDVTLQLRGAYQVGFFGGVTDETGYLLGPLWVVGDRESRSTPQVPTSTDPNRPRPTPTDTPTDPPPKKKAMLAEYRAVTEQEKAEVVALGGLHVVGTERHESRRIDNQLRGRSGRQGDPGSTRFFLSLEDPLFRYGFGGGVGWGWGERVGLGTEVGVGSGGVDDLWGLVTCYKRVGHQSSQTVEGSTGQQAAASFACVAAHPAPKAAASNAPAHTTVSNHYTHTPGCLAATASRA
jgi:hypothetical protein